MPVLSNGYHYKHTSWSYHSTHLGGQPHCPARSVTYTHATSLITAKWCRSGRNSHLGTAVPRLPQCREQRVNQLDNTGDCDHAYFAHAINSNVILPHARVKVENIELDMLIDTGAGVNKI